MCTSETVPFSKSGGLADVVGALSFALAENKEKISVFMPLYGCIEQERFSPYTALDIEILGEERTVEIVKLVLNGVTFYALKDELFTGRKGIYGDTSFAPYADNSLRYTVFSLASVELAKHLKTDIVHCHDWTTGLIPFIIKQQGLKLKTIYTIHNLAYQGDFSRFDFLFSNLKPTKACFMGKGREKRFNMMKCGLECADIITTVSPTYAKEIQEPILGCNLDKLLNSRAKDLFGIINGIDIHEWDSEKDPNFEEHFSCSDLFGKAKLKAEVQEEFGLEVNPDIPLISMISRIADQKGFCELLEGDDCALEHLASRSKVQFLIIGTGDKTMEDKMLEIASRHENVCVKILFSNRVAHRVEGASDFFLMPSRYEPCGLNQLYSLRYGTLPIARKTGGLADSIIDLTENSSNGTGFLFEEITREGIIEAVDKAIAFYEQDRDGYQAARVRAMQRDSSWNASAEEYKKVYKKLVGGEI